MAELSREIPFEAVINFRDIGGYRTANGRAIRWRRLFRAGALHRMTPADVERARNGLGIATVLDLRHPDDLNRDDGGVGPLIAPPMRRHGLSILPESRSMKDTIAALDAEHGQGPSGSRYFAYLGLGGLQFARAFEILAGGATAAPAVIHCEAGKDRTGVLIAMLLDVLGVDAETITADYALTNRIVPALIERLRATGEIQPDALPEDLQRRLGAPPDAIAGFLERLHDGYGSARGFLATQNVPADAFQKIEAALLE